VRHWSFFPFCLRLSLFYTHFMRSLEVVMPLRWHCHSASLRPPLPTRNSVTSFSLCWGHEQWATVLLFLTPLVVFLRWGFLFYPPSRNESCHGSHVGRTDGQKILVKPEQEWIRNKHLSLCIFNKLMSSWVQKKKKNWTYCVCFMKISPVCNASN